MSITAGEVGGEDSVVAARGRTANRHHHQHHHHHHQHQHHHPMQRVNRHQLRRSTTSTRALSPSKRAGRTPHTLSSLTPAVTTTTTTIIPTTITSQTKTRMTSSTNTTTTTPANHIPATAHSCSPHTLPTPSSSPLPLPNSSNISTHSQHERPSFTFTLPTRSRPSSAPAKGDTTVEHCVTLLSSVYSAKLDSPKPHVRRRRASVSTVSMKTGVRLGWLGRLVVAWMGIYMAVVGSAIAENSDVDRGNPREEKSATISFQDRNNEPESPCITAAGKTFLFMGKSATMVWDRSIVDVVSGEMSVEINAGTSDVQASPGFAQYQEYFRNLRIVGPATSQVLQIPVYNVSNTTVFGLTFKPLQQPQSNPKANSIPVLNGISIVDPATFKCNRLDGATPFNVPLEYILPPVFGTILLFILVVLLLYVRRMRQMRTEMKGKAWSDGPRVPELREKKYWEKKVDWLMHKIMPSDGQGRQIKRFKGKKLFGKKGDEDKVDEELEEGATTASSLSTSTESDHDDADPTRRMSSDHDEETARNSSASNVPSVAATNKRKGDTSVPSYLNSNDSTPRRSFSSSFRSLVKFPGGSSPNDTASASTSASTAKDDHPTKPSKKVVSIFDDDDDNRPAIHPRQLVHGPPDRNTGGSSQWCPPHPPGLRHIVQVPHLPEMADELAVVRGEVVIVERYFEDGWILCRRENPGQIYMLARTSTPGARASLYAPLMDQPVIVGSNTPVETTTGLGKLGGVFSKNKTSLLTTGLAASSSAAPASPTSSTPASVTSAPRPSTSSFLSVTSTTMSTSPAKKWLGGFMRGSSKGVEGEMIGGVRGMVPEFCVQAVTEEYVLIPVEREKDPSKEREREKIIENRKRVMEALNGK